MPARILPDETTGDRFQFKTASTNIGGVARLTIGSAMGGTVAQAVLAKSQMKEIRHSGCQLALSAEVAVQFRVTTGRGGTRIGYVFEFREGLMSRSVLVDAAALDWLLSDLDPVAPAFSPPLAA